MIAKDEKTGISIRFVQQWDVKRDQISSRHEAYVIPSLYRYRWWTFMAWNIKRWGMHDIGVKIGPLSISVWRALHGPAHGFGVYLLRRWAWEWSR